VPVTVQRRAILEELARRDDHPTADDMYAAVQERIPGVSRTTVYRVLDTLVDVGAARRVAHPGAAVRYDAKVHRHHHLVCSHCGKVRDLEDASLDALKPRTRVGFEVYDYSVHFTGLCAGCRGSALTRGKKEKRR
jgi:Fur family peroxide stress response transcriptional regulator